MIRTVTQNLPTWILLIDTLQVMKDRRQFLSIKEKDINSDFKAAAINSSIIIHIAAIVEGAINSLLVNHFDSSKSYRKALLEDNYEVVALYESAIGSLFKSTWSNLRSTHSQLVLGYKLDEKIYSEFKSINYLFEFRNLLAHGGLIVRRVKKISSAKYFAELQLVEEEIEENLTKEKMFDFLKEKGLVKIMPMPSILKWDSIINSDVVDYFNLNAKKFLNAVFTKYSEENRISIFIEDYIQSIELL